MIAKQWLKPTPPPYDQNHVSKTLQKTKHQMANGKDAYLLGTRMGEGRVLPLLRFLLLNGLESAFTKHLGQPRRHIHSTLGGVIQLLHGVV